MENHLLLRTLGVEPFDPLFTPEYLHRHLQGRRVAIKQALLGGKMNDRIRSYTYLYPEPGQESAEFWVDPDAAAEAARAAVLAAASSPLKRF